MNPKIFPTMLIILDVLSAIVWLSKGDYRQLKINKNISRNYN